MATFLQYNNIDASWLPIVHQALQQVDPHYLQNLTKTHDWLPGKAHIFNAFTQPLDKTRYILFGESPYPRAQSANGYAFWDAAVKQLWSPQGLSKQVNRATSLRNFIKMLLVADGQLSVNDTSQTAIARLDKTSLVQHIDELFGNLLQQGFLLLNASLVLSDKGVPYHAKAWRPFINSILEQIYTYKPDIQLILFGKIAQTIEALPTSQPFKKLRAEHPYNISFINNQTVIDFFKPMKLVNTTRNNIRTV